MKRRWLVVLLPVLVVLLIAVVGGVPTLFHSAAPVEPQTKPIGASLRLDGAGQTDDPLTFRVAPGAPFEGQVVFENAMGQTMPFLLLCLLDYIQTPCISGESALHARFTAPDGGRQTFNLYLPQLNEGHHDLIVVVFYLPDHHSLNPQFRQESRFLYSFHRVNLVVGAGAPPSSVPYRTFGEPDEWAAQGLNILTLTQERVNDPWDQPWRQADLRAEQQTPYHVWWNNPAETPSTFALIALLDYEQVPLIGATPVLYGKLPSGQRADIVGALTAPSSQGPHEFLILVIQTPYVELARQAQRAEPELTFTYSSDRVLVTVQ